MLKYPNLKSLSAVYYHFPTSVKMIYSVSGECNTIFAAHPAKVDFAVNQKIFFPLIIDSGSILLSITMNFSERSLNYSTVSA